VRTSSDGGDANSIFFLGAAAIHMLCSVKKTTQKNV